MAEPITPPAPTGPALASGPVADPLAEAAAQRAADHYAANRQDDAMREVDSAIALGTNARYEALRARILSAQGRYSEALAQLDSAIQLDSRNAALYEQRAVVHTALGDDAAARLDMRAAEQIQSGSVRNAPPE